MKILRNLALCLVATVPLGCATPEEEPIDEVQLVSNLESRSDDVKVLRQALSQVSGGELALLPRDWAKSLSNPAAIGFWQARALVWEKNARQARWNLAAELARTRSAGLPDPIKTGLRTDDLSDIGLSNQVTAVFDLLGLLGVGSAPAEAALAQSACRAALGTLEVATWRASFDVLKALVDLACAKGKEFDLSKQLTEAQLGSKRAQKLINKGRIGVSAQSRMAAFVDLLGSNRSDTTAEISQLQANLANASGLLADSQAIQDVDDHFLEGMNNFLQRIDLERTTSALLNSHPQLRRDRLNYAVAEARLKSIAAEAWPKIGLGPKFEVSADNFLTGGILNMSFPWPGSIRGRIDAATHMRSAARAQLQDRLLDITARLRAASESRQVLRAARNAHAIPAYQSSAITWRGQRARFQVNENSWDLWTDALNLRRRAIINYWNNRRDLLNATVEEIRHGQRKEKR